MKTNEKLQKDVQDAIKWKPLLHAAEIGVTVEDGIVSLTGTVDNYAKKMEAENATKKVVGVKAVVEKIKVRFPVSWAKTNVELAKEASSALKTNWSVPDEKVTIEVEEGWITLEGQLHWNFQREAAQKAIQSLTGVKGITNKIKIKSESPNEIEKRDIEIAIERSHEINNNGILVSVSGTTVTLSGTVSSWYQKEEAGRLAYNTPGISHVENDLKVDQEYTFG